MGQRIQVRIIKSEIFNFKNVEYGEIKYPNYSNAENHAKIEKHDVIGIYGQNGSGKTAMIEGLDILKSIISGMPIDYKEYEGLVSQDELTKIVTVFFLEQGNEKYKVKYEVELKKNERENQIQLKSERLTYLQRGSGWKNQRSIYIENSYYNNEAIINGEEAHLELSNERVMKDSKFYNAIQKISILCAQRNISVFFNDLVMSMYKDIIKDSKEDYILARVTTGIINFGRVGCYVIKVSQLGDINHRHVIPVNVHYDYNNVVMHGSLPLVMNGQQEVPEDLFNCLELSIKAIDLAIKAIVPNLSLELKKVSEEVNNNGINMVQASLYSVRNGKRFLAKYESEGIKRIISLLDALIAVYNNPEICLIVDELDSGVFEYLLGELLGTFWQEAQGQLIFTSHNLRILEKIESKNIICTTTNPKNRYIRLTGVEKNHNKRDFYIRTIVVGGQKEELYDEIDLQAISYAFKKAIDSKNEKNNDEKDCFDFYG